MNDWLTVMPEAVKNRYELFNFNHAVEIISQAYPSEYEELINALNLFSVSVSDIVAEGGSESAIPKNFPLKLRPLGWQEVKITGDLIVKLHRRGAPEITERKIKNFIAGHNIDYVKIKSRLIWSRTVKIRRLTVIYMRFGHFMSATPLPAGLSLPEARA